MVGLLQITAVALLASAVSVRAISIRGHAGHTLAADSGDVGCPAGCSGHGDCDKGSCFCYAGYSGTDCAARLCPSNCSGHGTCNSTTGLCACAEFFASATDCSKSDCPTAAAAAGSTGSGLVCGGHGTCNTATHACACLEGWTGAACDAQTCPGLIPVPENTTLSPEVAKQVVNGMIPCSAHGACNVTTCVCDVSWSGRDCATRVCDPKCRDLGHGSCLNGECVCNAAWRGTNCEFPVCPGALRRQRVQSVDNVTMTSSEYYVYAPIPSPSASASPKVLSAEQQAQNMQSSFQSINTAFLELTSGLVRARVVDSSYLHATRATNTIPELRNVMQQLLRNLEGKSAGGGAAVAPAPRTSDDRFAAQNAGLQQEHGQKQQSQQTSLLSAAAAAKAALTARALLEASFCVTLDLDPLQSDSVIVYCAGHGRCGDDGICTCGAGWNGTDCSVPQCPASGPAGTECSGHGTCQRTMSPSVYDSNATCHCDAGWTGSDCSQRPCPNNCTAPANGKCDMATGNCTCADGYKGLDCAFKVCPGDNGVNGGCFGRGDCGVERPGVCRCKDGFFGAACEFVQCITPASLANKNASTVAAGNGSASAIVFNGGILINTNGSGGNGSNSSSANSPPGSHPVSFRDAEFFYPSGAPILEAPAWLLERILHFNPEHLSTQAALALPVDVMYTPCGGDTHGLCHAATCYCHPSWTGAACQLRTCHNSCNAKGLCLNGNCVCSVGWGGSDCSQRVVLHGKLLAPPPAASPSAAPAAASPSPAAPAASPSAPAASAAASAAATSQNNTTSSGGAVRFAAVTKPNARLNELSMESERILNDALSSLEHLVGAGRTATLATMRDPGLTLPLPHEAPVFLDMPGDGNSTTTTATASSDGSGNATVFVPVLYIPGISPVSATTGIQPVYPNAAALPRAVPELQLHVVSDKAGGVSDAVCDSGWVGPDCSVRVPVCNGVGGTTHSGLARALGLVGAHVNVSVDGCGMHGMCTFNGCACEPGWLGSSCEIHVPFLECSVARHPAMLNGPDGNPRTDTLSPADVLLRQFLATPSTSASPSVPASPSPSAPPPAPSSNSTTSGTGESGNGTAQSQTSTGAGRNTNTSSSSSSSSLFRFRAVSDDGLTPLEDLPVAAAPQLHDVSHVFDETLVGGWRPESLVPGTDADAHAGERFAAVSAEAAAGVRAAAIQSALAHLSANAAVSSMTQAQTRLQKVVDSLLVELSVSARKQEIARWDVELAVRSKAAKARFAEQQNSGADTRQLALGSAHSIRGDIATANHASADTSLQSLSVADALGLYGLSLLQTDEDSTARQQRLPRFKRADAQVILGAKDDAPSPAPAASPSSSSSPSVSGTGTGTASVTPTASTTMTATPTPSTTSTTTATPTPSTSATNTPTPSVTPSASYLPVAFRVGYGVGMVCGGRGRCVPDWAGALAKLSQVSSTPSPSISASPSVNATAAETNATAPAASATAAAVVDQAAAARALVAKLSEAARLDDAFALEAKLLDAVGVAQLLKDASSTSAGQAGGDNALGAWTTPLMQALQQLQVQGICKCIDGFRGPACEERYVMDGHGSCDKRTGACTCFVVADADKPVFAGQRWSGSACQLRTCDSGCSEHGVCDSRTGTCACLAGWGGPRCATRVCPSECNYHGRCTLVDVTNITAAAAANNGNQPPVYTTKCVCDRGWGGADCGTKVCPNDCSGHGMCMDGATCFCKEGWVGDDCSLSPMTGIGAVLVNTSDPQQLSCGGCNGPARGLCVNGTCFCNSGYVGVHCESMQCPNQCSSHGVCTTATGLCTCLPGWTGNDCNTPQATATPQPSPGELPGNTTDTTGATATAPAATPTPATT